MNSASLFVENSVGYKVRDGGMGWCFTEMGDEVMK